MTTGWYQKAVDAAGRIEPAHTSPWKLASTYALLSIAESVLAQQQPKRPSPILTVADTQSQSEFLTVTEVAEMARLSVGTLRYWR
jgi:hypothetical protein